MGQDEIRPVSGNGDKWTWCSRQSGPMMISSAVRLQSISSTPPEARRKHEMSSVSSILTARFDGACDRFFEHG